MRDELLQYYEQELTYLRQMGGEFARKHPRIAGRLLLTADGCDDPHVERLIESFAFMAARAHRRIDDDFPQLSEALLNLVYPSYLRPLPSMTIVECLPDPAQGKQTAGLMIPRETPLVSRVTVDGMPVRFQTSYDVTLWPLRVSEAEWRQPERLKRGARSTLGVATTAAARLRLSCGPDVEFAGLGLERLRFHLTGDPGMVYPLYELLAANCVEIQLQHVTDAKKMIVLEPERLRMAGFENEESVLPIHRRSLDGHRMLQEYFTLPEKFLFFDLEGLEELGAGGFGTEVDVVLLFSRFERPERQQVLELGVNDKTFRLGCTPAINLFKQTAEPILMSQARTAYTVVADARQSEVMEIYSVDEVVATNPKMRETTVLEPIHTYRYQTREVKGKSFWSATRKMNPLGERKPATVSISVVDLDGRLKDPEADVLTVRCTCTNFDLATKLVPGTPSGELEAVGFAAAKQVKVLRPATKSVDPPNGVGELWRLISQLSLNYLSLGEEGRGALQEILRLHNFTNESHWENQIRAIMTLESGPDFAMVLSEYGLSPARGTAVRIRLDEQQFTGGSAYLLGAVLDRFLAGYCSVNSFTRLTVSTTQREKPMTPWDPRAGTQVLL